MDELVEQNESILNSVKTIIGIDECNKDFDPDLVLAINAVLFIIYQEGLSDKPYRIHDWSTTWSEVLIKDKPIDLETLITWTGLKVKQIFDPPTSSILAEALKNTLAELEWRGFITQNYVGEIGEIYD